MADEPIIARLPNGDMLRFPAGTPEGVIDLRVRAHLRDANAGKPQGMSVGDRMAGANPVAAGFHLLRHLAPGVADWAATRGIGAGATVAGAPRATGDLISGAVDWVGQKTGADPDIMMRGLPLTAQVASTLRPALPSRETVRSHALDVLDQREVNLPGRVGRVIDTGVESMIGSAPFGPGALIPGATAGMGSEVGGQLTEGTPWEVPARLLGAAVGGGAGAAGQAAAKYGFQAGRSVVDPFYQGGRERVVGSALNRAASDPKAAAARMQASVPTVPGSRPTAAQAANDPGLLALENLQKSRIGDQFAMRTAESNAARSAFADAVAPPITAERAGDTIRGAMQTRKDALTKLRGDAAGPMYDAARLMDPSIPARPILDYINNGILRETGGIRSALQKAKESLTIGEGKNARTASSVADWQAVRRALDEQIAAAGNNPSLERVLVGVRQQVDDALKSGPMFKMADTTYRQMSEPLRPYSPEYGPRIARALEKGPYGGPYTQPSELISDAFLKRGTTGIDEMLGATGVRNMRVKEVMAGRMMDDFKSAIRTTADDPLDNKVLSAAAADRWWQANKDAASKVMTPDQVRAMQTLVNDFAVGARRPQGAAGPITAQNLASGNILNAVLRFRALAGSSVAETALGRALSFIYKIPEERLQETLATALLDPKVASALMVKASPGNAKLLAPLLQKAMVPSAAAGALDLTRTP